MMSRSTSSKEPFETAFSSHEVFQLRVVKEVTERLWDKYIEDPNPIGSPQDGMLLAAPFRRSKEEERVQRLLGKNSSRLQRALLKVPEQRLKMIYNDFLAFSKVEKTKALMVKAIVSKFYRDDYELKKRKKENENLKEISVDELFLTLNGVNIPRGVALHILSYISYNAYLLKTLGYVSKDFYLMILTSWKVLKLKKRNFRKVSLLVLRSIKELTIQAEKGQRFQPNDLEYIFDQIDPVNVESLIIHCDYAEFPRQFFQSLAKRRKQVERRYPFSKLRKLRFGIKTLKYVKEETSWRGINLSKLFPELRVMTYPPCLKILRGCSKLDKLMFSARNTIYTYRKSYGRVIHEKNGAMPKVFSLENILRFVHEDTRNLVIKATGDSEDRMIATIETVELLKGIAGKFHSMETLQLTVYFDGRMENKVEFLNKFADEDFEECFDSNKFQFVLEKSYQKNDSFIRIRLKNNLM